MDIQPLPQDKRIVIGSSSEYYALIIHSVPNDASKFITAVEAGMIFCIYGIHAFSKDEIKLWSTNIINVE